jgi:hypothetical protein
MSTLRHALTLFAKTLLLSALVIAIALILQSWFEPQPAHAPRFEATVADVDGWCQKYSIDGRAVEFCAQAEVVEPMITEPCAQALARGKARVVCPEVERGLVQLERRKD